jgi:hypothetical protein
MLRDPHRRSRVRSLSLPMIDGEPTPLAGRGSRSKALQIESVAAVVRRRASLLVLGHPIDLRGGRGYHPLRGLKPGCRQATSLTTSSSEMAWRRTRRVRDPFISAALLTFGGRAGVVARRWLKTAEHRLLRHEYGTRARCTSTESVWASPRLAPAGPGAGLPTLVTFVEARGHNCIRRACPLPPQIARLTPARCGAVG